MRTSQASTVCQNPDEVKAYLSYQLTNSTNKNMMNKKKKQLASNAKQLYMKPTCDKKYTKTSLSFQINTKNLALS